MKNNRYTFILLVFLLAGMGNLAMADPSVTVVAPDGGAQWQKGTTRIISWYKTELTQNVKVELWYTGGGGKVPVYGDIVVSTGGTTYPWTIPMGITNGWYQIRVYARDMGWTIWDASESFQIVSAALPFVTALTPNGSESWARGTTHTITWDDNLTSNVKIELCTPAGASLTTIKSSATGNSFNWYIPSNYSVGYYKIKISNVNNPACYDFSNIFPISASTGGTVTVLTPATGDRWNRGAMHLITWNKTFTENVRIDLCYPSGTRILTIKNQAPGESLNWYIPSSYPLGSYKIKVSSVLDGEIADTSESFQITASAGGNVTVENPKAGDRWNRGASHLITWDKTFTENVRIDLCDASGNYILTIKNQATGESLNWYIPSYYTPGNYMIKVSSVLDGSIADTSEAFEITLSAGGTIVVTSPAGGEIWAKGTSHPITWEKTCTENVRIDLCDASGNNILTIKNQATGESFNWYIPNTYSEGNYTIRISSVLDNSITNLSGTFTLATFKFAVYPNPVIGSVMNLQLDDMLQDECTVEMFDRYGSLVCNVPCNVQTSRHLTIPVGHLPNDLYLVVVTSGDVKVSQKVMIQH